jgi:hypothetical protein
MKHKLLLIFSDDSEIPGINKMLIFNNELDAETYLLGTGHITNVIFRPDETWFSFKTNAWSGNGTAQWVVDMS